MELVLQNSCNYASNNLQNSYNDFIRPRKYDSWVCTKKESGRRIKTRREELGLTLADVCSLVDGLSVSRLSNWEHGRNMISVDEAKKLSPVLGLPVSYILTIDEEEQQAPSSKPLADEFNYVYDACSEKGRKYLERAIDTAKGAFVIDRRKENKLRGK